MDHGPSASFWQNELVEFVNENSGCAFPPASAAAARHALRGSRFAVRPRKAFIDEGRAPPYFPRSILREICPRRSADGRR